MLFSGIVPCTALFLIPPVNAADTMVVIAAPQSQTESLDTATPSGQQQASLGALGKRQVLNVPWSVQTMSNSLTRQLQANSIKDIYRYFPSVQGDGFRPQTRGMQGSVVQNSMVDGLNVVSTTEYPAEQFERIEVLSGLAGALYGPANPAGMFNMVSKRPTDIPLHRVSIGAGTGSGANVMADLSGPIDASDRVKYRLNLTSQDGSGYTHGSRQRNQYAGLGIDYQLTDKTVLESNFNYYHYYQKGLPATFALAKGVHFPSLDPVKDKYGQSYAGNDDTTTTGSLHIKHDFDGNWLLDVGVLRQIADRELSTVTNTLTDDKGDYTSTVATGTASRFTINSYLANLTGSLDTGWLQHDLAVGMRGFVWKNFTPRDGGTLTIGKSSLDQNPTFDRPAYPDFTDRFHSATTTQHVFLLNDTLTFNPQWSLLLSGSENLFTVDNFNKKSQRSSTHDDAGASGSASLMYKPVDNVTLYTTWANSMQQGDTAPVGASNAGEILNPYHSHQIELGAKYAPHQDLLLTTALFQSERPFAYVNSNGDFAEDGTQKNRGFELMADGHVTPNLRLFGGAAWLDPRLHNTATAGVDDKQVVGLPRFTANMLAVYSINAVPGLDVNSNIRYVGRRATDNVNDNWVGSYTTVDIGSNYQTQMFSTETTFRLAITNITDRHYWSNIVPGALTGYTGAGSASAQMGAPRQATVSVQFDF
ncbi:TonB-dependent receptor [Raoultella planticola]